MPKSRKPIVSDSCLDSCYLSSEPPKIVDLVSIIDACYSGAASLPDSRMKAKAAQENAGRALATYDRILFNRISSRGLSLLVKRH